MLGFLKFFTGLIFPPQCLVCGEKLAPKNSQTVICDRCFQSIEINNGYFCPLCRARLPEAKNACHPKSKFALAAAASYQNESTRELIHALKYRGIKGTIPAIKKILEDYLAKIDKTIYKTRQFEIIPIPLHPKKEKERGFNQTALISEIIAENLKLPITYSALVRIKNTASQTKLKNYKARAENIADAFLVKNSEQIKNKNFILIDDVFTSGATMAEVVKILKLAGAKKIIGFVVAKT